MKKVLLSTLYLLVCMTGGNGYLSAQTLSWNADRTTAVFVPSGQWAQGDFSKLIADENQKSSLEEADTLVFKTGYNLNNDDINAINSIKNVGNLIIECHQGNSTAAINNPCFKTIDMSRMASYNVSGIKNCIICNSGQITAYPVSAAEAEIAFKSAAAGELAAHKAFIDRLCGNEALPVTKIIIEGTIDGNDIGALKNAATSTLDLRKGDMDFGLFDISGNTCVKYVYGCNTWASLPDINTGCFDGCTQLAGATVVNDEGTVAIVWQAEAGNFKNLIKPLTGWDGTNNEITSLTVLGKADYTDLSYCTNLTSLNMKDADIKSEDLKKTQAWANKIKSITFPENDTYTEIADNAFANSTSLAEINIPVNVRRIGKSAFSGCVSLPSHINLGGTHIEVIDESAFANNPQTTFIRLPETLKRIEKNAFQWHDCRTLRIPASVEFIGTGAFINSAGTTRIAADEEYKEILEDVYFQGRKAPVCEDGAFSSGAYHGYGGMKPVNGNLAERNDYINGDHYIAILHYRPDLTKDEEKQYVDMTRVFTYDDLYLGSQRKWPTHEELMKSYNNVDAGKFFDETPMTDEEKQRTGIYKFVLTRNDAPVNAGETGDNAAIELPINDNGWWTICLPFSLDKENLLKVFGEDTRLFTLESVIREKEDGKIHLNFTKDVIDGDSEGGETVYGRKLYQGYAEDGIKAWYPYLIKPSKDFGGKNVLVSDYMLQPGSEVDVTVKADDEYAGIGDNKDRGIGWYYVFRGNCSGTKTDVGQDNTTTMYRPNACYFLGMKNGAVSFFYQNLDDEKAKAKTFAPNTCVVLAYNYQGAGSEVNTPFSDDSFIKNDNGETTTMHLTTSAIETGKYEPTGINDVVIVTPDDTADGDIYNTGGQLVRRGAKSLGGLKKGIYVTNGKKVIVK